MVQDGKPGAAARRRQGIEGRLRLFRGTQAAAAAIADENAGCCPAGQRPGKNGAGGQPSCLDPIHSEDRRADEPVPLVEVEGKRERREWGDRVHRGALQ